MSDDLKRKIRELPHKPGVYIFKDRLGRIIYVGKARDLRKRVSQYFHPGRKNRSDLKTKALIETIRDLDIHVLKSEAESILLEGRLIKEYRPKYNISFRDDKRFLMVKVNLNEPYPRFQLTRIKKDDGSRYFGPFADSGALRSTLNLMRKKFHLRACKPTLPTERDYRHCLDHIIKNCSAPCIGKISRDNYLENVRQACEFLEGKSNEILSSLEAEMERAAQRQDFEKAAQLRNALEDIRNTTKPQRRFLRDIPTTVVPEKDLEELRDALGLAVVPEIMECFDISNISTTHNVASMVCFKAGRPWKQAYRRYRIKTVTGQDDFASMAEAVRRRYSRLKKEQNRLPDLIIVDGGKGQLSAARSELTKLGFENQPMIGLAKQEEEIYFPGKPHPLVLPHETGALRLLQRIRDEAHRFANQYHQLLMKKRMAESILDEIPGISRAKKTTLLKHFGSIEAIRKAGQKKLAGIPGISSKQAKIMVEFFGQD